MTEKSIDGLQSPASPEATHKIPVPTYVTIENKRVRVESWNGWMVTVGGREIASSRITNLIRKADRWIYLCPGKEHPNTLRWAFFTSVWKDAKSLENPDIDSTKIRKRWARWLRNNKRQFPIQTFIPASDRVVLQAIKVNLTEKSRTGSTVDAKSNHPDGNSEVPIRSSNREIDVESSNYSSSEVPTISSSGETDVESSSYSNWSCEPESMPEHNYSDNVLYSKISCDTDIAVLVMLHARASLEQDMLLKNINMRLRLHYSLSAIDKKQAIRLAKMLSWMFESIYSLFDYAKSSFAKAAMFLGLSLSALVSRVQLYVETSLSKRQDKLELEKMAVRLNEEENKVSFDNLERLRRKEFVKSETTRRVNELAVARTRSAR